eukprot:721249-Amphidinium_carterae.3
MRCLLWGTVAWPAQLRSCHPSSALLHTRPALPHLKLDTPRTLHTELLSLPAGSWKHESLDDNGDSQLLDAAVAKPEQLAAKLDLDAFQSLGVKTAVPREELHPVQQRNHAEVPELQEKQAQTTRLP